MPPRKENLTAAERKAKLDPFRRAVLRGLGLLLPPLLTIAIFLWLGNTITDRMLVPMEGAARWALLEFADIRSGSAAEANGIGEAEIDGRKYHTTPDNKFIPVEVYAAVERNPRIDPMPVSAREIYKAYINQEWLRREYVIPVFLSLLVLLLYLLGKFMAAGVGHFFWSRFELLIHQLPIVRNVYSSVKQVTDFLFTDPDVDFTRVVAVEYPRKGIWTLGLVTGESMLDIRSAANEPVLSILVPTSPMPFTGFTMTVKRSETIDLNISIDQAFQFIISCGVVVPPQQIVEALASQRVPSPDLGGPVEQSATLTAPVGSGEG